VKNAISRRKSAKKRDVLIYKNI